MDGRDLLHSRGRALEAAFFAKVDQQLLQQLKEKLEQENRQKALAEVTGIRDPEVLEHLAQLGAEPETLIAFTLIPVIAVAWADGKLEEKEAVAILDVSHEAGLDERTPGRRLLEHWLEEPPPRELYETWFDYIEALKPLMRPEELRELRDGILKHTEWVAKSCGATLGLNAISHSEKKVLKRVREAFES